VRGLNENPIKKTKNSHLVEIGALIQPLARQLIPRQPLAYNLPNRNIKPLAVSQPSIVEAITLFIKVAEQVEGFN